MSHRSKSMRAVDKENPLLTGLGVALIAAVFATLLSVVFGALIKMWIGGRLVIDYEFWGWPIAITAACFGCVTVIWTTCKNLHSRFSEREPTRLLSPPRRV